MASRSWRRSRATAKKSNNSPWMMIISMASKVKFLLKAMKRKSLRMLNRTTFLTRDCRRSRAKMLSRTTSWTRRRTTRR